MRERRLAAVVSLVACASLTGCATMHEREWGSCAVAGAVIGAAVGGITGGVAMNNIDDDPSNSERGAAIGGGVVAGGALGALLGHAICDDMKAIPPPPPPAKAAPPPAPGTKLGTVGSAFFDFNKSSLKAGKDEEVLGSVVRTLKDNPSVKVSIEGHTDSVGSDAYNQRLSERRAEAVKDYLVRQGVDAGRMTTTGYGESKPVAPNDTESGRGQNRRAEIIAR